MSRSGKWLRDEVPKIGWTLAGLDVVEGDDLETCEMCEREQIRYVQLMHHEGWAEDLRCGCVCAGWMTGDDAGAQRRDAWMHSVMGRRGRWLTRRWNQITDGWTILKTNKMRISLMRDDQGLWGGDVRDNVTKEVRAVPEKFAALDDAKLAAFPVVLLLEHRRSHSGEGRTLPP